jgi:hypothetical protein
MALTELKYRTFDDLLDSVKIDLYTFDLEGLINPQQLIKVAMRVNYDLGLRIAQQKSRVIDITKGKGRLPDDMDVLNFALACDDRTHTDIPQYTKTYQDGVLEGVTLAQNFLDPRLVRQSTTITDVIFGDNVLHHDLHTINLIIQAFALDGSLLDFDIDIVDANTVIIKSESEEIIENVKIVIMGARITSIGSTCNSCPATVDDEGDCLKVKYVTNGRRYESINPVRLHITKAESISAEPQKQIQKHRHRDITLPYHNHHHDYYNAYIKNGYLHTQFDEGVVYINYQSVMEDEDGNLLILDNPYTNEYYEYAIKHRIFENLFMSGEPVNNHLQLMTQQLRAARNVALGFVNTPDFAELKKIHEINRKAMYAKYYDMFKNHL